MARWMDARQFVIKSVACRAPFVGEKRLNKCVVVWFNKMNPLAINQLVLTWFSACAAEENTAIWKKTRNYLLYVLMVVMHSINVTASGLFFIENVTTDYIASIYAFLSATVLTYNVFTLITFHFYSEELLKIFSTLNEIRRQSKKNAKLVKIWINL